MNQGPQNQKVGRSAGRTPALLSQGRESVPPSYKPNNTIPWRKARRFAQALISAHDLVYEQIEEKITYVPNNIILKSQALEKYLPAKAYTDVYAFKKGEFMADIRLAKQDS